MVLPARQFYIVPLIAFLIILPGCASTGTSTSEIKVGLHIDAVLELVVEYPLHWQKDRRLEYGRNEGEIRWSPPERDNTLLQVTSYFLEPQTDEQEPDLVLKKHPDLTETSREQVELPAGQAWHVSGHTAQRQVEIYLILSPDRAYSIVLKTSPKDFADYDTLMAEIVHSFQILTQ